MTAPTVPVTVRLADFGGNSEAGIVVTARMSDVDYMADGTFVANGPVEGTTDADGLVTLNLFPNAAMPSGLGTRGTTVRVRATLPNSRRLSVIAVIPNEPCSLASCVVNQEPTGLDLSQQAASDAQAARNLAKRWATQTDAEVEAGQGFGAKKYAQDAAADRSQTALDRIATGEDRVQTGLDKQATAADRVQTGLDRTQTGLDRTAAASSAAAAAGAVAGYAGDVANVADSAKGAALVGWDGASLATHLKDRLFRRVADVAALRALDKTKYTASVVGTYSADTGANAGLYLYDSTDTTTAESLPYVVVATDGGRWKISSPMEPARQDSLPVAQITNDPGDRFACRMPRQLGIAADLAQLNVELPLHIGTRRNLHQRTEDLAHITYQATSATKQTDTVTVDGITLTRLTSSNFFGNIVTNWSGLGLTPFVAGERYLLSYYVLNRGSAENFFWMRSLANGGAPGHGAKLAPPNTVRRVWELAHALSGTQITHIITPTSTLGTEGADGYWFFTGNTEGGAVDLYVGGFMVEKLATNTYKNGIAMIGDSTMEGASGATDSSATSAREVSVWLGALLNVSVFNRANGGEATNTMDARWATDITTLAANCKYAIIQGGINDINTGRTLADMQTSIGSMVTKATSDGLIPVLFTCTPFAAATADPAKESLRQQLNAWMKATYPRVIDIASVVADPHNPASLRRAKGWFGDGTHYGSAAKRAVAAYVAQWNGWDFTNPSPYQPIPVATYTPPGSALTHNGLQVVGARETGWTAGTGTPNKAAFAADTATAVQAAQRVLALEQAMRTHGLIN